LFRSRRPRPPAAASRRRWRAARPRGRTRSGWDRPPRRARTARSGRWRPPRGTACSWGDSSVVEIESPERGDDRRLVVDGRLAVSGGIALTAASGVARAGLEFADQLQGLRLRETGGAQRALDAPDGRGRGLAVLLFDLVGWQELVGEPLLDRVAAADPGLGVHELGHGLRVLAGARRVDVGHRAVERLQGVGVLAQVVPV